MILVFELGLRKFKLKIKKSKEKNIFYLRGYNKKKIFIRECVKNSDFVW